MNENNLYVFGGSIVVSGKLDNGNTWRGYRIMLAPIRRIGESPVKAILAKASCNLESSIRNLKAGDNVYVYFDEQGRVAYINIKKEV